nr:uncharacterized protein LOC112026651 [Quercus suber]
MVTGDKWGMGNVLGFGMIDGFQIHPLSSSLHHRLDSFLMHGTYKVALSSTFGSILGPSNEQNSRAPWKSLWDLNVPNKIKNFAWHASRSILPTKANLCHQKVLENPTCEACGMEAESNEPLFWKCDKAREIWTTSGIQLTQHVGDEILELVITIAWSIWFNRNQVWKGKADQSANMIIHKAISVIEEFQHATGVAAVIRDHEGRVVAALSKKLHYPLGPLEANAKAMEEAVELAWDVGIQDAHFESYSLILSNAIQGL